MTLPKKISEKPNFLKAIELVLADPKQIQSEVFSLIEQHKKRYPNKAYSDIQKLCAQKIVKNYSYYSGFVGGTTGLSAAMPGVGTVAAILGGGTVDVVTSMKFQIEMTMALATIYEHDILIEEEKRLCMLIAGVGAITELGKKATTDVANKAFVKMIEQYLKGAVLQSIKEIFKRIGIEFTKSALKKSLPFGVGAIIGFNANKLMTKYIGNKAIYFFECEEDTQPNKKT